MEEEVREEKEEGGIKERSEREKEWKRKGKGEMKRGDKSSETVRKKRARRKERRRKERGEQEREREKVIARAGYCNLKASRCFRILPRTRRFISTHRVLLPSHFSTPWGYLPGGINNRRGSARGV